MPDARKILHYRVTLIILFLMSTPTGMSACKGNPTEIKQPKQEKQTKQEPEEIAVGRLTFLEKNVFVYLRDTKDWSLLVRDVPVKDGDVLYSDVQGRSEVTFPNKTWIRINDATKIQVDAIKRNQTLVYVNSGVARVHNHSTDTTVQLETAYGKVLSRQPSTFDIYITDSSVAVTALEGTIGFVDSKNRSFEVKPGPDSLLADETSVVSFGRFLDEKWDGWNNARDNELRSWENNPSPFLPDLLQSDAKTLAENGNWQRVTYESETAHYWTPTNVPAGWSPFTVGQWTIWNQEQLWVPHEPFGWVTHHYGGWIFVNERWYWRPPTVVRGYWLVAWYPARVAWVDHDRYIGWVPLSYREVYYGHHYWGPRTVVYNERINRMIEVHKYLNVGKAVVIEKERLYRANRRYDSVTESRVIKEVVNSGRAFRGATRDLVRAADLGREHHFIRAGDVSRIPKFNPVTEFTARRKDLRAPAEVARISNNPTSKTSTKVVGPVPSFANSRTDQGNKRGLPEAPRIHAPARDLGSTGITKSSQPITQKGEAKSTPLAKTQTTTQNASQSPDAALAKRGELRERMTGRSDKTVLEKTQVSGTAGATRTATAPSSKSSTMAQTAPYRQQQLALAQQQQQAEAQRLAITQRREQQLRLARQQQVQRSHRQVTPTTTGHTVQHQSEKPKSNAGLKTK